MTIQYEDDLFAWAMEQAQMLRAHNYSCLDAANVAEELEAMAGSQRRELASRLHTLLFHLLKWQSQRIAVQRTRSWQLTIREQRRQIGSLLEQSPSLRNYLDNLLIKAWVSACKDARLYTPLFQFPERCPWTFDEFMAEDFLPGH